MQLPLPWHSGRIAGPGGRILICLSDLAVCMLVVTGIMIWQRKRQTRQAR
ncbi:PepSY domain-containing protein [Komagataeibacter xylinus]